MYRPCTILNKMSKIAVSEKNTKNEILDAYRDLLQKAQEKGSEISQALVVEDSIIKTASEETAEKSTADLTKLKQSFNQTVGQFSEQLVSEAETLATIKKAIVIAKKDLEETHKIKTTVFQNPTFTIFESLVKFLKEEKSFSFHEISLILNRDERNIWTIYKNTIKKVNK